MALLVVPALVLAAPVTINWWHAHGGALGEKVNEICDGFNKSQNQYQVVPTYKGNYSDTMNAGIAAFRAKTPPHILQVFEVGTATMMAAKGAIKPVYEVMKESGLPFDPGAYLPTVAGLLHHPRRQDAVHALQQLDPDPLLQQRRLQERPASTLKSRRCPGPRWPRLPRSWWRPACARPVSHPPGTAGSNIENLSAWHNVPIGTKDNGFGGLDAAYTFNGPLHVKHIQQLADWQKDKIFVYGGRTNVGNAKFSSGEVAMYTESSAGYAGFKKTCQFDFGTAMLPYWPDEKGAPQNTIIGGASLWVLQGPQGRRTTRGWPPSSTTSPRPR